MHTCNFCRSDLEVSEYGGIKPKNGKIYWHVDERYITEDIDKFKVLFRLQLAFKEWQSYVSPIFESTSDINQAAIVIRFMSDGDSDLPEPFGTGTLAYAFFPSGESAGIYADIYFNDIENWQESHSSTGINLFKVAVHEIGHALGLGHSDNINDIMFPSYQPNDSVLFSQDTIQSLQTLYSAPASPEVNSNLIDASKVFILKTDISRLLERSVVEIANELGLKASLSDKKSDTVDKIFNYIS